MSSISVRPKNIRIMNCELYHGTDCLWECAHDEFLPESLLNVIEYYALELYDRGPEFDVVVMHWDTSPMKMLIEVSVFDGDTPRSYVFRLEGSQDTLAYLTAYLYNISKEVG